MKNSERPKLAKPMGLRLPVGVEARLDEIGAAHEVTGQKLLREAAAAIIRYADANGAKNLPLHMEIRQQTEIDRRVAVIVEGLTAAESASKVMRDLADEKLKQAQPQLPPRSVKKPKG
jgi:hypothetical protein